MEYENHNEILHAARNGIFVLLKTTYVPSKIVQHPQNKKKQLRTNRTRRTWRAVPVLPATTMVAHVVRIEYFFPFMDVPPCQDLSVRPVLRFGPCVEEASVPVVVNVVDWDHPFVVGPLYDLRGGVCTNLIVTLAVTAVVPILLDPTDGVDRRKSLFEFPSTTTLPETTHNF